MSLKPDDYLEHNLALLREMMDLAERQIALLRQDRVEETFSLAARSRKLQHQVGENARRSHLLMVQSLGRASGRRSEALIAQTAKAFQSVQELNEDIETLLLQKREELLADILKLRKGQRALQGYGAGTPQRPRFVETNT